jgi:predicted PurR-regulated permease PerM
MFPEKKASDIFEFGNQVNNTFGGFINGKIIDSIIIGILCFIGMTILNMPLAVLISVIVGITNIIPFFGPFIGAIPSGILLLFVDPVSALKFAVWILVLQQIDGNIIGPRILGKATKLASFWVMFAILVGGGLFGFIGMVLGVPTMAIIYIYVARMINNKLKKKDMTINTLVYENFDKYKIDKEEVFGKEACDPNEGL